jgi:PAS domain S-box-containing protein
MIRRPDPEWRVGPDGRVKKLSEVWLEIVGRRATEAPGYCWLDHVHQEDRERIRCEIAAHRAARRAYVVAFRVRHQTGRFVWVHSGGSPLPDGSYVGSTHVAKGDIRPMRRMKKASCCNVREFVVA